MAGNSRRDLVSSLRARLADDRPILQSFFLSVTANAKAAYLEIANGILSITIEGGESVSSLRWNLSLPKYNTVGRLVYELTRERGYSLAPDASMIHNHPSNDLCVDGIIDISNGKSATLKHFVWSDAELTEILEEAVSVHNPNYTPNTVPPNEKSYVLLKAVARSYYRLAADVSKRKGLDVDVKVLLQLAESTEKQYAADVERLRRIIPVPKADEFKVGSGDVMQGGLLRRSLRQGYTSPYREAIPLTPPTFYEIGDEDIEDTTIRLRWSQSRKETFAYFEVWRDIQPNIERSISGRLATQYGNNPAPELPINTQFQRMSTAKQVLGFMPSLYGSPVFDGFFFWTAAEMAGNSVVNNTFIDGVAFPNPGVSQNAMSYLGDPLEPEFEYYYRVFAVNTNKEITPSEVRKYRTKPMRARFLRSPGGALNASCILPKNGPLSGGTTVTITGTYFVDGMQVLIGGKKCVISSQTSTQAVVVSPTFTNTQFANKLMDVVLISPTGLKDIVMSGWRYDA